MRAFLERHPAPWRKDEQSIVRDANGNTIEFCEELERLGLAAPELLDIVKRFADMLGQLRVEHPDGRMLPFPIETEARALIQRIEKGAP